MEKPTRADLEAMRQEYEAGAERADGGVAFNVVDDIRQARQMVHFGMEPERWAEIRGVPVEYARALLRYVN